MTSRIPHASAYGSKMVSTPNFDRIARDGHPVQQRLLRRPRMQPVPRRLSHRPPHLADRTCRHPRQQFRQGIPDLHRPARRGGLCYRLHWQGLGTREFQGRRPHAEPSRPELQREGGRLLQPASRPSSISARRASPFCFWFGSHDPHRGYEKGSGLKSGKTLAQAEVPGFLPDTPEIRGDLLDYALEVERFDRDCGKMLALLEATGELDNTLIIVTSDNGMPFPYAKANCTEFGIHMPLALSWKIGFPAGRKIDDLVSFIDLTATIHELTGIQAPAAFPLAGTQPTRDPALIQSGPGRSDPRRGLLRSRAPLLVPLQHARLPAALHPHGEPSADPQPEARTLAGRTRTQIHRQTGITARPAKWWIPRHRCLPEPEFPDREAERSRDRQILPPSGRSASGDRVLRYRRPTPPASVTSAASQAMLAEIRQRLEARLDARLRATGDPRVIGDGDVFETYPRYSGIRWFPEPDWAKARPGVEPAAALAGSDPQARQVIKPRGADTLVCTTAQLSQRAPQLGNPSLLEKPGHRSPAKRIQADRSVCPPCPNRHGRKTNLAVSGSNLIHRDVPIYPNHCAQPVLGAAPLLARCQGDRIQPRCPPDPLTELFRLPRPGCPRAQGEAAARHRGRLA